MIPPSLKGPPNHSYDLLREHIQPLARLVWQVHQQWEPEACADAASALKTKKCYVLAPGVGYTNATAAINMATHAL